MNETYIGNINGLETYRVTDAAGNVIGVNQRMPSTAVPEQVTARQARLWLIRHGITLAQVDAVIAAIPDAMTRQTVQIDWEYATEVRRASPFVEQLGQALGLDDAALDVAFREAASI